MQLLCKNKKLPEILNNLFIFIFHFIKFLLICHFDCNFLLYFVVYITLKLYLFVKYKEDL